ncbi:MAG: hypothetical protein ABIM99_03390 [Candidatus Dojkabacteria bacterium]
MTLREYGQKTDYEFKESMGDLKEVRAILNANSINLTWLSAEEKKKLIENLKNLNKDESSVNLWDLFAKDDEFDVMQYRYDETYFPIIAYLQLIIKDLPGSGYSLNEILANAFELRYSRGDLSKIDIKIYANLLFYLLQSTKSLLLPSTSTLNKVASTVKPAA